MSSPFCGQYDRPKQRVWFKAQGADAALRSREPKSKIDATLDIFGRGGVHRAREQGRDPLGLGERLDRMRG
jgi:hypothetical protein